MGDNTKLVVIFNHRYEDNVEVLEDLYRERFAPTFLMPFYRGGAPNVLAVHDSSHRFHGFVSEAHERFRGPDVTHYLFAADDLFLNPALTAENVTKELGLGTHTGWVKELRSLASTPFVWEHLMPAVETFQRNTGVEHQRELPAADEARRLISRHAEVSTDVKLANLRSFTGKVRPRELRHKHVRRALSNFVWPRRRRLPYPLVWGYSDCFVVPAGAMDDFVHYCGVFAAMDLFVEVAIPTALALACEDVATERDIPLECRELWTHEEQRALVTKHEGNIDVLTRRFDPTLFYVHPVKLSQWER
jgi:hypothetical protein